MKHMNDLVKLANSVFGADFVSRLRGEVENLAENFKNNFRLVNCSSFVDEGENYVLTLEVDADATSKNVTVDVDGDVLTVNYERKTKTSCTRSLVIETLPEDADLDTLQAFVEDGAVTITVEKLPEPETETEDAPEEEEDLKTIKITRK